MKRLVILLSLLLAFGLANAQTLVYGLSGFPSSLDSVDSQDGNSLAVSNQITETLIFFEPGTTNLVPRLATEWEANEDGSVWTVSLREGVMFQDGTPFNAEAVKFNFDRWNDPEHPHSYRDEGKNYVPWGWVWGGPIGDGSVLEAVNVVDEFTVEFVLTKPLGLFPNMIAAIYFQMDSPTAVQEAGADYGTPGVGSVGTGPFAFAEWREGEQVRLTRYEDYWDGAANVEEVVVRGIEEPTARLAALQAGELDVAALLSSDDLTTVENDPNLEVAVPESELNVGYIGMHQSNEPFGNPQVREAIAHAIDYAAIVDAFYEGLGTPAVDFIPPSLFGHADFSQYEYDPERSRELLAEAGFPDGFDTEFWYMPVSRPYYPAPQPIAETIASYLADVGINATLQTEDWTTYLDNYSQGKYPMYMLGWNGDYADPDNFLYTFFGPSATNDFGWDDPETVQLLEDAREASEQEERANLYAEILTRVHEQVPAIPVAHNVTLNAVRSNVSGWNASPLGYSSVSLKDVTKE